MRALARRRASENLAGMLRTVVNSAMVISEDQNNSWIQSERFLTIDEGLVDQIEQAADHEIWFDLQGEGPFRARERTYNCACLSTAEAGIQIDATQAAQHAIARQYTVDEVPKWLTDSQIQNRSVRCAIGYHERMFHPEEMFQPLTESVRTQLTDKTRSWVLSEFTQTELCGGRDRAECTSIIDSVVEAANEGISRGVALTAVWLDTRGLGPNGKKMTAYGWGCVFDRQILDGARRRLAQIRAKPTKAPPSPTGALAPNTTATTPTLPMQ